MNSTNFIDPEEHKRVVNENLHLRGKAEKSRQKIGLLKAVLKIVEDDLNLKNEQLGVLYKNLQLNPLWNDLQQTDDSDYYDAEPEEEPQKITTSLVEPKIKTNIPYFDFLPKDLCMKLSSFLTHTEVCALAGVNRQWYQICKIQLIWKVQYTNHWKNDVTDFNTSYESEDVSEGANTCWYRNYKERSQVETNWAQGKSKIISLPSHTGSVTALQFDRSNLLTASDDGSLIKWGMDATYGNDLFEDTNIMQQHHKQARAVPQKKFAFCGHGGPVWCLHFQGNLLASGSYDKTVKLWNMNRGNCLLTLRGHEEWVSSVQLMGNLVISASWDASIRLWKVNEDRSRAQCERVLRGEQGNAIYAVKLHPYRPNIVATGCRHNAVQLWDIERGETIMSFVGHTKEVQCLQIGENTIVSGSGDSTIKLWDARTGGCVHTFSGHVGSVMALQYDNNKIISGGYDKACRIFDLRSRRLLHSLYAHSHAIFGLQFDSDRIVTGSADTRAILWQFR